MILPTQEDLRARVVAAVSRTYGLQPSEIPQVPVAIPPNRGLGDLAVTVAFELARRLRKPPRVIGQEIAAALGAVPGVARIECAANGYLNVYLERPAYLAERLSNRVGASGQAAREKVIVEHTAINPNKAAHIGHLRNAALGDTLVRALRFLGHPVEIQNYIDDTGVQVADVVVGFRHLEGRSAAEVEALAREPRFDYACWDLYAKVTGWYDEDKERLKVRAATLHEIERGEGETAAIGRIVADRIVRCHLKTMARLNVQYDLLTWEGDILRLQFWNKAFERLKAQGTVYFQDSGRLNGCWVMRIEDGVEHASRETRAADLPAEGADGESGEEDQAEKVIVRSNGTVTYVGKDMAYQFWKFGLLGEDFHYRLFGEAGKDGPLWATSSSPTPEEAAERPVFGKGHSVYNVIDVRQSYLQRLLSQALAAAGHPGEAERSIHFSYEMVALSHQTAKQLGYSSEAEDAGRPFVEVSGRKGLGVKADDLVDTLVEKALAEVDQAQRRNAGRRAAAHREHDRGGRGAVLHGAVLAGQGHRVRHRRGAELRGRERAVPAVLGGAGAEHLPETARPGGARRGGRRRGARRSRRPGTRDATAATTRCGPSCSRRRASTRSRSRPCGRSSSPAWPSGRSAWRSCSTRSIIATRCSARRAGTRSCGAPPASPTSARR